MNKSTGVIGNQLPVISDQIRRVRRDALRPCPFQPRKTFNEEKLNELGLNLRGEAGIINPLTVRWVTTKGAKDAKDNADGTAADAALAGWDLICPDCERVITTPNGCCYGLSECEGTPGIWRDGKVLEIVCGECRWRASGERRHPVTGEVMGEIGEVPIIIRELSDAQALEIMLSENMQRNDLSPLEECDAFAMALEQRDAAGGRAHTLESLAEKIGVSRQLIQARLSLRKLPAEGREALRSGAVSYRVLREVCQVPRALVAKVLDVVLNPKKFPIHRMADYGAPLSPGDVAALAECMSAELLEAPFDLADAGLVPLKTEAESGERIEGGACLGCQFNSTHVVAVPEDEGAVVGKKVVKGRGQGKHGERPRCLNAGCYKKKVEVHVAHHLVRAKEAGGTILKDHAAEQLLKGGPNGTVALEYVELEEKIGEHERAPGVTERQAPTWEKVVSDGGGRVMVPVFVAVDSRGRVRRFAERGAATVAAEKLGTAKYLSLEAGRGTSVQMKEAGISKHMSEEEKELLREREAEQAATREAELAAQKLRTLTNRRTMGALVAAVEEEGVPLEAWEHLLPMALTHAGKDGCAYVVKRRELELKGDVYAGLQKHGEELTGSARMGLVVELLFAQAFSWAGAPTSGEFAVPDGARGVMKFYGVEVKRIAAGAKGEMKEQKSEVGSRKSGEGSREAEGSREGAKDAKKKRGRAMKRKGKK